MPLRAIAALATLVLPAHAHAASRILYVGNWSGHEQIYAVDPSGRMPLAQVTEPGAGDDLSDPRPSPDGRYVLFRRSIGFTDGGYWVARTDGVGGAHRLESGLLSAEWSPDGRLLAYIVQPTPTRRELHVVRGDGAGDRRVASLPAADARILWSRDSRHVRAYPAPTDCCSITYSPDGLWVAYARGEHVSVAVAHPGRQASPVIDVEGSSPTWAPNGRLLAYVSASGISVLDVYRRKARVLEAGAATHLAWSPDGRSIAYVARAAPFSDAEPTTRADLRTVTLAGRVHVVMTANADHLGIVSGVAWTRAPYARYRRPPASSGVYTVTPITSLSADGDRVVYAACGNLFSWTPATGSVSQLPVVEPVSNFPDWCANISIYDSTVSGNRVGYATIHGGNNRFWELHELLPDGSTRALPTGDAQYGAPTEGRLAGAGGVLVYASPNTVQIVGGPTLLASPQQPERPTMLDVDRNHVLVGRAGDVEVFDAATGAKQLQLSVDGDASAPRAPAYLAPADMRLTDDHLVVRSGDVLYDYDLSGVLGHTWQLAAGARLLDADHGLVAYGAAGEVHVLRLSDGADDVVAVGALAHFMDGGLAVADGAHVDVVPNARLPR